MRVDPNDEFIGKLESLPGIVNVMRV